MIAFAAIAPHGGLVFEQPEAPTRRGMEELARRDGHGHTADGPYGFAPESKEYDYEAPTYFGMLTAAFRSRV
jgi:hypothetical protein